MNDQIFNERAHANPHDDSPEFLEAASLSPERQQLLAELKALDTLLQTEFSSVSAPEHLQQALLNIPADEDTTDKTSDSSIASNSTSTSTSTAEAANDSFWRRNFQYAAGVVVAIGVLAFMLPGESNPLEEIIFKHIYSEMSFLEDDSPISLSYVNTVMASRMGSNFLQSPEMDSLEIDVTEDCWVDIQNGVQGVHMVMKGNVGQVTVIILPNEPVSDEIAFSDERFEGVITPTSGGNLVVVGEKDESIEMYSTMLAANINW